MRLGTFLAAGLAAVLAMNANAQEPKPKAAPAAAAQPVKPKTAEPAKPGEPARIVLRLEDGKVVQKDVLYRVHAVPVVWYPCCWTEVRVGLFRRALVPCWGPCCGPCWSCCYPCWNWCGCGPMWYAAAPTTYRVYLNLNPQPLPPAPAPMPKKPMAITPERSAESLCLEGISFYWAGDYKAAIELLTASAQRDAMSPRTWYFKSLAERAAGDEAAAKASARRGAALEMVQGSSTQLGVALERVQGADRQFLRLAKSADLTAEAAQRIVASPVTAVVQK